MPYAPRIYVHAPYRSQLQDRVDVKTVILDLLCSEGLDLQEFHVSGLPRGDSWTFERAIEMMSQAHCFSMAKFHTKQAGRWPMSMPLPLS